MSAIVMITLLLLLNVVSVVALLANRRLQNIRNNWDYAQQFFDALNSEYDREGDDRLADDVLDALTYMAPAVNNSEIACAIGKDCRRAYSSGKIEVSEGPGSQQATVLIWNLHNLPEAQAARVKLIISLLFTAMSYRDFRNGEYIRKALLGRKRDEALSQESSEVFKEVARLKSSGHFPTGGLPAAA